MILRTIADVFSVFFVAFLTLMLAIYGHPFDRGYTCDDTSLDYPTRTKGGNLSYLLLCIFFVLMPAILFATVELTQFALDKNRNRLFLIMNLYNLEINFLFGIFASQALTFAVKLTTGRLSPDFKAACKPPEICRKNVYPIVYIFTSCLGNEADVRRVRMSFPSEQALMSTQSILFVCFYIEGKLYYYKELIIFKSFIQLILIYVALWASCTPFINYTHHLSDVLTGIALGFIFAVCMYIMLLESFKILQEKTRNYSKQTSD